MGQFELTPSLQGKGRGRGWLACGRGTQPPPNLPLRGGEIFRLTHDRLAGDRRSPGDIHTTRGMIGQTGTAIFQSVPGREEFSMSGSDTGRLRFASAMSDSAHTPDALREVMDILHAQFASDAADLILVFATMHHHAQLEKVCENLEATFGSRVTLGCTCSGVIGTLRELQDTPGLSVLVGVMPSASFTGFSYEQFDWPAVLDSPSALRDSINTGGSGGGAAGAASQSSDPRAILLLADPFSTPMVKLLPAFTEAFGPIPVFGGMASGASESGQNKLVLNGSAMRDGAVGLVIGGNIDVQTTVSQGCRPIGEPLVITRSKRNVVQELGGRKSLEVLRQIAASLSPADRELIQSNGVHVGRVINEYKSRFGRGDFLIRAMIGVDADDGYIAIGDPSVRTGQTIQFHLRDAESAENDFKMMLAAQQVHGDAQGALLFSCTGRGHHLFENADPDAGMVYDALGDSPLAGFFCAGEIGPVGNQSYVHSHTACLAVFRESE